MTLIRKAKIGLAALAATALLAGCGNAEALLPGNTNQTLASDGSPEVLLGTDHEAPEAAPRRDFNKDATVVSLTFDDGNASQLTAVKAMDELGLKGTFYVNTSVLETDGYYSLEQLDDMVREGHEIGGHALQHRNLKEQSLEEVQRQVCWDRQNLLEWGYQATNFAYPEAAASKEIEKIAEECGYNSARGLGSLRSITGCDECDVVEDFDPKNLFYTKVPAMVESNWTLQDLKDQVTTAEQAGGGWVQLTFHHVCPEVCNDISIEADIFKEFIRWLKDREQSTGTVVRTVNDVIGGELQPAVAPKMKTTEQTGNLVVNSSLEEESEHDLLKCWQMAGYGNNAASGSVTGNGPNGSQALRLEISEYTDGDAKFLQRMDAGQCSPEVVPGQRYELRSTYQADTDTQFVVYLRDETGEWVYWKASEWFAPNESGTQAKWVTPQIPEGFTGMSFGLSLFSQGTLLVDEVQMSVKAD
ncbi:polysaccharide deacetylase family protein [Arthrobacter sp. JCM 19049]|uniref:polysaccharide deacetylase family protein n=1 Tax=Arthrobacter sp. JCM 19049 TaxID=1460643 RepID=UPI000B17FD92|nr:polysaccharide deacetylase family protein [Arthrobacter sp. JCM 19049]